MGWTGASLPRLENVSFEHFLSSSFLTETHTALSGRKPRRVKPFLLESRDHEGSQIKRIKPGGWEASCSKGISAQVSDMNQTGRFLTVRKHSIKKKYTSCNCEDYNNILGKKNGYDFIYAYK